MEVQLKIMEAALADRNEDYKVRAPRHESTARSMSDDRGPRAVGCCAHPSPGRVLQVIEEELAVVLRSNDNLAKEMERLDTVGSMMQYQVRPPVRACARGAAAAPG